MDTLLNRAAKNDYRKVSKATSVGRKSKESVNVQQQVHKIPSNISKQVSFAKHKTFSHIFEKNNIVEHYLESVALQNSGLLLIKDLKLLVRRDHESMVGRVKILSGGASGMEPLHSGFVGPGMLTAAVFGDMSSSPPYMNILEALRLLSKHSTKGIIVIVMNNIADRLNFGLACELAAHEGIKTMCITVGEDCSGIGIDKTIGRRGLCGILFLQKVAGAMSEEYRTLFEIYSVLLALKGGSLGSINISIVNNGLYVGTGLKGEPGKFSQYQYVTHFVSEALFYIFHPGSYFSLHIEKGDNVAVIVNNLGRLSDLHLALVVKEIFAWMKILEINMVRVYSGRFLTVTSYIGVTISVLKVSENVLKWLDSSVNVTSWPVRVHKGPDVTGPHREHYDSWLEEDEKVKEKNLGPRFTFEQAKLAVSCLGSVNAVILNMEEYLNELDLDHDYGTNMKRFVACMQREMDTRSLNIVTPYGMFNRLAEIAAVSMGGVSGAVYSVIFSGAAQAFLTSSKFSPIKWQNWIDAARMARDALGAYTRAQLGSRTVLDALDPFTKEFTAGSVHSLSKAVKAALQGAEDTLYMGGNHKYPDPGAYSLAVALRVVFTELQVDLMMMIQEEGEEKEEYCDECLRLMAREQSPEYCSSCMKVMALEQREGGAVWFCDSCLSSIEKNNS